jgi:putative addiction module component (TIGR02574 family)
MPGRKCGTVARRPEGNETGQRGSTTQTARRISVSHALELETPEGIRLVEAIWDSIAAVPEALELAAEQREEVDLRLAAYATDPHGSSPSTEVKERIAGHREARPREGSVAP